jgi:hypothetical protein
MFFFFFFFFRNRAGRALTNVAGWCCDRPTDRNRQYEEEVEQVKGVVRGSPDYGAIVDALVREARAEKEQLYALQIETDTVEQEIHRIDASIAAVERTLQDTKKRTQELSDSRRALLKHPATSTSAHAANGSVGNSWMVVLFGFTVLLALLLMAAILWSLFFASPSSIGVSPSVRGFFT